MTEETPATTDVAVREARPEEFVDAMRLFEGALLTVDAGAVRRGVDGDGGGAVIVAVDAGSVVGALYAEPSAPDTERPPPGVPSEATHVVAVAVRRRRRGRGIGRALVLSAAGRPGALTAAFDPEVRPFYDSLGFDIEVLDGDGEGEGDAEETRHWGVLWDGPGTG